MIVPSMTAKEIHKEVFEDIKNLQAKMDLCRKQFKRSVLNARQYPLSKTYDCITRERKNLFVLTLTALKRSHWSNPFLSIYGIYTRPEGKYAVAPSIDTNMVSIYPPHFFKRYRERILKDESLSNEQVIRDFFLKDWGMMMAVVNEDYEAIFHKFENNLSDKVSFVSVSSQGYCFGEKQGNVNIMKTIISDDMLFGNQEAVFHDLKTAFRKKNKEKFNIHL